MSDPIGKQGKIPSSEYRQTKQKLVDTKAKQTSNYGSNKGTRSADTPTIEGRWQGTTKRNTTHTYGE